MRKRVSWYYAFDLWALRARKNDEGELGLLLGYDWKSCCGEDLYLFNQEYHWDCACALEAIRNDAWVRFAVYLWLTLRFEGIHTKIYRLQIKREYSSPIHRPFHN